jgi:organic radical activating enzyme
VTVVPESVERCARSSGVSARAPVLEVFASIQGEGRFVGEPQTFLRLAGCPLRCRWCDTPGSWRVADEPRARLDTPAGRRHESGFASPFQAATWIAAVEPGQPRTVSVTGGEPLVWPDFVRELKGFLGPRRLHLETAGAHPRALERVLERVDHVSLDLKLPADLDAPEPLSGADEAPPSSAREWAEVRARVLALVRGRDACGKLIVAGGRAPEEFLPLLDDVASIAPELPLVLQPVTPVNGVAAPTPEELGCLVELALERRLGVRVVPQIHRQLGIP